MRDKSRWLTIGVLVLVAVALQGCDLSEKEIDDIYTAVEEALAGVEQKEIGILFPKPYCFPSAPISWAGKLTQSSPPPSLGFLRFEHCPAGSMTCTTFASLPMSFQTDGTIPRQGSTLAARCFAPNDMMNVYFTPIGGKVQAGAFLHFNFRFNVSDDGGGGGEIRTLRLIVQRRSRDGDTSGGGRAAGKVVMSPPGRDCVLSDRPHRKETLCIEDYQDGEEVTLTAIPDDDSEFRAWALACGAVSGPVCKVLMNAEIISVRAEFQPKESK